MKRTALVALVAVAALSLAACSPKAPEYATRAEKIVAEIHNPSSKYVVVASHRGDWRNFPENSIPAIESVIKMGVDIMELDLKMTKDSVLVLSHDRTIDRCTNGKGKVSDFTLDSLKTFRLRRAHNVTTDSLHMPTLEEALKVCKDRIVVTNCISETTLSQIIMHEKHEGFEVLNHGQFYVGRGYDIMVNAAPLIANLPKVKLVTLPSDTVWWLFYVVIPLEEINLKYL